MIVIIRHWRASSHIHLLICHSTAFYLGLFNLEPLKSVISQDTHLEATKFKKLQECFLRKHSSMTHLFSYIWTPNLIRTTGCPNPEC